MTRHAWPHPQSEVAYFRDREGTWFAAEVARAPRWTSSLLAPLDEVVADVRIAFLDEPRLPLAAPAPGWLAVLGAAQEAEPAQVVQAALAAWEQSLTHRTVGPPPQAFVVAGFQALCPPHPPCEPGPTARESLGRFLRERPGILGDLGEQGRDAFNRSLRLYWDTPDRFADAILRERIRDEGCGEVLDLAGFIREARVASDSEFTGLAVERTELVRRLAPERFFTDATDFDRAVLEAHAWVERYQRAYARHYRGAYEAGRAVLAEVRPALAAAGELSAQHVGAEPGMDAVHRLAASVTALQSLPPEPEPGMAITGGVVLGHFPAALADARLAAAAVLAALDLQRWRTGTPRRG